MIPTRKAVSSQPINDENRYRLLTVVLWRFVEDMVGSGGVPRASSMGWASPDADLNSLMQRRSSSLGLALMSDNDLNRRSSIGSLGQVVGLEGEMPPHRPFVGGGSAAAYEAARADHYAQKREEQQRRASSLGLGLGGGNLGGGAGLSQMGMSVNPNQHYEMLKLHHMNLLNEIQETTLMMNLYQQQQLQQQQQQLQQQQQAAASEVGGLGGADPQMALLLQQQHHQQANPPSIESLYGGGLANQRASLGLGSPNANQMQLLRQQQMLQNASGVQQELLKGQVEQAALEDRLLKLKEDIARRQKEAEELEATAGKGGDGGLSGDKRKVDDGGDNDPKRVKLEDDGDDDDDDDDDDEDD